MPTRLRGAARDLMRRLGPLTVVAFMAAGTANAQTVAHVEGFRVTVVKFQRAVAMANRSGVLARAKGAYLLVSLSVSNDGPQPRDFDVGGYRCVDKDGRSFELAREALDTYLKLQHVTDGFVTSVPPYFTRQVTVMFDVSFEDKDFTLYGPNSREPLYVHLR